MIWNYRICKKKLEVGIELSNNIYSEDCYGICEVYYNDKGEIIVRTENFIEPYGETLEGLKMCFEKMKEAFDKEVLDLDNIVYAEF